MNLTRAAPPAREDSAFLRRTRRYGLALVLLVILAAVVAPLFLLGPWTGRFFRAGPALLSVSDVMVGDGGRYGPLPVARGHYYQINLQTAGTQPFVIRLDYQDGSGSRSYDPARSFDEGRRELRPVIRATRDDPAASLVVAITPGTPASPLGLRRLRVYEFRQSFYVWRAVVRIGSLLTLLAGVSVLGWRCYLRWNHPPESRSANAILPRRAALWAAVWLTLMIGFGVFVFQSQHARLFQRPRIPSIYGWDASFYYFWLRSAVVEGDVDFAKDLRACSSMPWSLRDDTLRDSPRTKLGLIPNKYPIGWALFEAPWYAAADGIARTVNATGGAVPRDGWGPLYQVFLILGQSVYAAAGLWLACRLLAEWLPPPFAVSGVALGWLCSPLAFYQTVGVTMAHNVMFLAVVCAYAAALALRRHPAQTRWWVAVGVSCALAILSRYQGAVLLLFPGVVCLQEVRRSPSLWTRLVAGVAASTVPLALQALAWKALYGSYLLYTYEGEGFDWLRPHLWESFFSPFHGLFNWHPALLVGFLGFAAWAVRTSWRTEAICFAMSLGLTIYVNSAWQCWWFGDSFGGRAYEGCTLFAMLGFGWTLRALAQRRIAFQAAALALLLAGLWNMNLLWLSNDGPLPLSRPVPWQERLDLSHRYWFPR